MLESASDKSLMTSAKVTLETPAPPYSLGTVIPWSPLFASFSSSA